MLQPYNIKQKTEGFIIFKKSLKIKSFTTL